MTVRDLEPASYVFRAFRKGAKSGETAPIDCTGKSEYVTIQE